MHRSEFLQQLLSSVFVGKLPISITKDFRKIYLLQCFVAGFRHYLGMEHLNEMQEGDLLEMIREPENEYDECAIALHWKGHKIGFIPRETNEILSKLLDANALSIFAVITHLEKNTKPWENVAIAVYFIQEADNQLSAHADYLTRIEAPHYRTLNSKKDKKTTSFKTLMENSNRVVNLDGIPDHQEYVKEYLQRYYDSHKITNLKGGKYVLVPDDGIYEYFHSISEEITEIVDDLGNTFLEFKLV